MASLRSSLSSDLLKGFILEVFFLTALKKIDLTFIVSVNKVTVSIEYQKHFSTYG